LFVVVVVVVRIDVSQIKAFYGLFIYSAKTCLRGKTSLRLGHIAPASEVAGGHTLPFLKGNGLPILQ
jgi:hypothetical protein